MAAQDLINRFRSFREGHLVLARIARHPYWPATIAPCTDSTDTDFGTWKKSTAAGGEFWCEFIGLDEDSDSQNCWIPVDHVKLFTKRDADYSMIRCRSRGTRERLTAAVSIATDMHAASVAENGDNPNPVNRPMRLKVNNDNNDSLHNKGRDEKYAQNNNITKNNAQVTPSPSSENEDDDDDSDDGGYDRAIDANERAVLDSSYRPKNKHSNSEFILNMDTISLIGDLVLAKTGSYPFWPAIVQKCVSDKEKWDGKWVLFGTKMKPLRVWCMFVGDTTGGWVPLDRMCPYVPAVAEKLMSKRKSRLYGDHRNAVQMANKIHHNKRRLKVYPLVNDNANQTNGAHNNTNDTNRNYIENNNSPQDATEPEGEQQSTLPQDLEYSEKDIVLAKFDESLPFWPALIHKCSESSAEAHLLGKWHMPATDSDLERFCCFFLVDCSECWVPIQQMKSFNVHRAKRHLCSKGSELYDNQKKAIDDATALYKKRQEEEKLASEKSTRSWNLADIVLAKHPEAPFWPARIQRCGSAADGKHLGQWRKRAKSKTNYNNNIVEMDTGGDESTMFWCSFISNERSCWVNSSDIKPFAEARARHYFCDKNHPLFARQKQAVRRASDLSLGVMYGESAAVPDGNAQTENGATRNNNHVAHALVPSPPASTAKRGRKSRNSEITAVEPWRSAPRTPRRNEPRTPRRNESRTPRDEPMTPKNSTGPPEELYLGDLVLVPFRDAYWPARIVPCPSHEDRIWKDVDVEEETTSYWCAYIYHAKAVWVLDTDLKPFTPHRARRYLTSKATKMGKKQREAVKRASEICRNKRNRIEVALTEYLDSSIIEEMERMDQVEEVQNDDLDAAGGVQVGTEPETVIDNDTLAAQNNDIPVAEKTVLHPEKSVVESKSGGNNNPELPTPLGKPSAVVQEKVTILVDNVMEMTRDKEPHKASVASAVQGAGAVQTRVGETSTKPVQEANKDPFRAPHPVDKAIPVTSPPPDIPIPRIRSPTPMRSPTSMASTSGPYHVPLPTPLTASIGTKPNRIPIPRSAPLKGTKTGIKANTSSYSSSEGGRKARGSRFSDIVPSDTSAGHSRFSSPRNGVNVNLNNTRNNFNIGRVDTSAPKPTNGNGIGQSVSPKVTPNGNGHVKTDGITTTVGLGRNSNRSNSNIGSAGKRPRTEVIEASGSTIKRQK